MFGDTAAYNRFAAREDYSFGFADVRDGDFVGLLESVLKALRELVSSGSIKADREVILPSVPMAFLRRAPLIEGQWVDRHVVELAEFGAMLAESGFILAEDGDQHPLAWPSIHAPKASAIGAAMIREQASRHMSDFNGRTTLIDGRPYLNLVDYDTWSERRLKGELSFEAGFSIASFNRWIERSDPSRAKLGGIGVESICPLVSESDFVAYSEVELAADAQERRREIIDELAAPDAGEGGMDRWRAVFRVYTTEILTVWALIEFLQKQYFDGHEVLWKSSMTQVEEAMHLVDELAILFDNLIAFRAVPSSSGFSPRSEVQEIKESIEPRATAKPLVSAAKANALSFIGRHEAAIDLLAAELGKMVG